MNRLLVVGCWLLVVGLLGGLAMGAESGEAELAQLEGELNESGFGWLIDYDVAYPSVEVYTEGGNESLIVFDILGEGWYKDYLTELVGAWDIFDLRISGGVWVDYVVDPVPGNISARIYSATNKSGDDLLGYCNATDSDGDALEYNYVWYNGSNVFGNGTTFKMGTISAGRFHSCGIRASDSRVLCWGQGNEGQLGDNDISSHDAGNPTLTGDSSAYRGVFAGEFHTCGIRMNDSRVLCWGKGDNGRLGDGDTSSHSTGIPTLTSNGNAYKDISVGDKHSCGVRMNDSRVLCWGIGDNGRLGDGNVSSHDIGSPNLVNDSSAYFSVSADSSYSCGIRANDSRVLCWGNGNYGKLGDGNISNHDVGNPNLVNDSSEYRSVVAGNWHACGIRTNDSRVLCWGYGNDGELGDGLVSAHSVGIPNLTTDTSAYKKITIGPGGWHTCGIRSNDSRVLCWGWGDNGQLGDGDVSSHSVGVPSLTTDESMYDNINVGVFHSCGIRKNDSRVLCWGSGYYGKLGNGNVSLHYNGNPNLTTDSGDYSFASFSNEEVLVSIVDSSFLSVGENWSLGCRAYDYSNYSSWMNSSSLVIVDDFNWSTAFNSTWNTSKGGSASDMIVLPLEAGGNYNFRVYWGDGSFDDVTSFDDVGSNHTYSAEGVYNVSIGGTIVGWRFNNGGDKLKILDVSNWGVLNVGNNARYFYGCENLNSSATDVLNLSGTTDLNSMFRNATNFNGNISGWDVSGVTDMGAMFLDSKLSTENYDSLLIGWSGLPSLQNNTLLGGGNSEYCLSESARQSLIDNYNWSVSDGGINCSVPNITGVVDINESRVSGGAILMNDNVTINVTLEDNYGIDKVWVKVWEGVVGISSIIYEGFLGLIGGIWSITFETNSSFVFGDVNYTVFVNNTEGEEINESGKFRIASAPTIVSSRVYSVNRGEGEDLVGYCNASDLDGDNVGYYYEWFRNGALFSSGEPRPGAGDPLPVGTYNDSEGDYSLDGLQHIAVSNGYVYTMSSNDDTFAIWDVSENGNPVPVGSHTSSSGNDSLDGAYYVAVEGDYAYTISYNDDTLGVWNISTHGDPVFLGSYTSSSGNDSLEMVNSVAIEGDYAYTVSSDNNLAVWDVSGNGDPVFVGWYNTTDIPVGGIIVEDGYLYGVAAALDTLAVWNVSGNGNPVFVGNYTDSEGDYSLDAVTEVAVGGNYAYTVSYFGTTLAILDISGHGDPVPVGSYNSSGGEYSLNGAGSVDVVGDYVYTISWPDDVLVTWDVSNRSDPIPVGSYVKSDGDYSTDAIAVVAEGDYIYTGSYRDDVLAVWKTVPGFSSGKEVGIVNVSSENLTIGDEWVLRCMATDFVSNSSWMNSSVLMISDVPDIVSARVYSAMNKSDENLVGYCNATDGDGDGLEYDYIWYNGSVVYLNGTAFREGTISVGAFHSCGIRANDSRVLCWGSGTYGKLGNGNTSSHYVGDPMLISDNNAYDMISAGYSHTCGIRSNDSRVLCWGQGDNGKLGDGNPLPHNAGDPSLTNDVSSYKKIKVGQHYICGIRSNDSRVLCWGQGDDGKLGDGNISNHNVSAPNLVSDTSAYRDIDTGAFHTCGIRANDSLVLCWGNGIYGKLGDGNTNSHYVGNPMLISDDSAYNMISAGYSHTCGIRTNDSRVLCWGKGDSGELGDGDTFNHDIGDPNLTADSNSYKIISSGNSHTCGIRTNDSRVLCWGSGDWGELGDGDTSDHEIGIPNLTTDSSVYIIIDSGYTHSCGVRSNDSKILC